MITEPGPESEVGVLAGTGGIRESIKGTLLRGS